MAKLFATVIDERGTEVRKIADRQLCAHFYYGSKEKSVLGARVCTVVEDDAVATATTYYNPDKTVRLEHVERFEMPPKKGKAVEVPPKLHEVLV